MDDGGFTGANPAVWPWVVTAVLILFANFIAVSETALSSCSKVKMKTLADKGDRRAQKVLHALDHFDRTISSILILTNISHIAAASLVTVAVTRKWGLTAVSVATLVTSLVLFFFAEMLPKSFAKKYANQLSLVCVGPMEAFSRVLSPFTSVLSLIGNTFTRLSRVDDGVSVTEDEIHDIIDDMTEEGSLDEAQGDLISSALEFNDVTVESVLTPRVDVAALDIDDDPEEILAFVRDQKFSRLPVYEHSIDNIIGILRIRRYLRAYIQSRSENGEPSVNIRKLLDEPLYVTESTKIDELLPRMSRERQSLAIVTDHYGGTVGIVTVEDILETLVGEIYDEEDVVEDAVIDLKNGTFLVDAEETVDDAFWKIGFEDPEDNDELVNTRLGEWVYEHFTAVPKVREHFAYHGLRVYVARMDHNRIRKVMLKLPDAVPSDEEKEAEEK
ncbi:MAG: HlyC/CorC family transporter [Clostridia bacterium]|nr:HlyC/CorC family transporter [Clostridia bacterium]